jgi:hypothetical protein
MKIRVVVFGVVMSYSSGIQPGVRDDILGVRKI